MKKNETQHRIGSPELVTKKECLLRQIRSVSNSVSPSFEGTHIAWEASTLPLSYTRQNYTYFNSKVRKCKEGECRQTNR